MQRFTCFTDATVATWTYQDIKDGGGSNLSKSSNALYTAGFANSDSAYRALVPVNAQGLNPARFAHEVPASAPRRLHGGSDFSLLAQADEALAIIGIENVRREGELARFEQFIKGLPNFLMRH
mmetsp:Transcript_46943/g.150881  ORF Transcript_46943/g.150881 Transcript_46943/m.150881 type:complete len:123 (-) Transcript_46943:796-1164(-)